MSRYSVHGLKYENVFRLLIQLRDVQSFWDFKMVTFILIYLFILKRNLCEYGVLCVLYVLLLCSYTCGGRKSFMALHFSL